MAGLSIAPHLGWRGPELSVAFDPQGIAGRVRRLDMPCFVVRNGHGVGVTNDGELVPLAKPSELLKPSEVPGGAVTVVAVASPISLGALGDPEFLQCYGLQAAYMAGSMANAISSEAMVIALGRAGLLGSFGAGGLTPQRLEEAIVRIQRALPEGPYAFNLIHSPHEPAVESRTVDLYIKHGVQVVEASAYLALTPHVVRYRAAGLSPDGTGGVRIGNRVIAKVSRREVAAQFLNPAPDRLLQPLVEQRMITPQQAALARQVPMADDITVEADSGGHTDNRPLVCLLPSIMDLRDQVQAAQGYGATVRVGAAGGIGTPSSALAAYMMGAAYVVTGSVNHSCVEAGTSSYVKRILAQADMADVMMAPAADMFEMGVNLQVLKRGTMFPLRARKLYELYQAYDSLEAIPGPELEKLEKQILRRSVGDVWGDCVAFFSERDPQQITRAQQDSKRRMALVFRWYLGLATRWAVTGETGRELDYQIWCGPAMGAFNDWVRGSRLEPPEARQVADVAWRMMEGAALLYRLQTLKVQGARLPVYAEVMSPS